MSKLLFITPASQRSIVIPLVGRRVGIVIHARQLAMQQILGFDFASLRTIRHKAHRQLCVVDEVWVILSTVQVY
jgi:hypothetical protein